MTRSISTPLGALFSILKRAGHISYKDLAALILSEKPMAGGASPISRVNDRTWISRYLVHAPVESVKSDYFMSSEKCAMRIVSRLKKHMSNREIMAMIAGAAGREMVDALVHCGQNPAPYLNMLARLNKEDEFRAEERVEISMVLFTAAALSANVAEATSRALGFAEEIHGSSVTTPLVTPRSREVGNEELREFAKKSSLLGLLRVVDGYVVGSPHWLDPSENSEIEVGAFATGKGSLSNVAADVSRHHARIWHDDTGEWRIEGMGSKNGTVLVSGADRPEVVVVEPPADKREGWRSAPVTIRPGDELVFGKSTRYMVIAGVR